MRFTTLFLVVFCNAMAFAVDTAGLTHEPGPGEKRAESDDQLTRAAKEVSLIDYEKQTIFNCAFHMAQSNIEMSADCKAGNISVQLDHKDLREARFISETVQPSCHALNNYNSEIRTEKGKEKVGEAVSKNLQNRLHDVVKAACVNKLKEKVGFAPSEVRISWPTYVYIRPDGTKGKPYKMSFGCQQVTPKVIDEDTIYKITH